MIEAPWLRPAIFVAVLLALLAFESHAPRRPWSRPRWPRVGRHLALVALDTLVLRLALPLLATGAAALAEARGWGLLRLACVPAALAAGASLVLLDLAIWAQHVLMHRVPWLWRLHRVHHSDVDFDTSTALRFHPLEILLSMGWKIACVLALGAPLAAVAAFEVLLSACALFNHANLALPPRVEAALRRVLVTPDVHRTHHSIHRDETDSNYGFSVVWWDRLFGTWRAAPRDGHATMTLGLDAFRAPSAQRLGALLLQPLRSPGPAP